MRRAASLAVALAACALLLAPGPALALKVYCETLTGVTGCAECQVSGSTKTCYLCAYNRVPVYTGGKITAVSVAS